MLFRNVLHIKAIERKCHVKTYIVFKDYPRHFVFVSAICDIEWRVTSSDREQIFGQEKNSIISGDFSAPAAYFLSVSPHCILTCTKTMDSQLSLSQAAKNLKIKRKGTKTHKKLGYRRVRLAVWCSGNALVSINAVALHRARLVLGWVTAFGQVNCLIT